MGDDNQGPIYFWRETERPYGFLSQWYESAFEVDGVTYQSAEMWMMIQKAKLFGDEVRRQTLSWAFTLFINWRQDIAQQMMQTTVPAEHQKLGRQARGFDRKKWDDSV